MDVSEEPMNRTMRKRLIISTLAIVVILLVVVAFYGASGASRAVTLAQAASGEYLDQRIQVEGTVVDNSYRMEGTQSVFRIYDPESTTNETLEIRYNGSVATTFGNGIVAICTGNLGSGGVLFASELVTKCPSKYESAEGSVTVDYLEKRGGTLIGQQLKVAGYVKPGTLVAPGGARRFVLHSQGAEIPVRYEGALPEGTADGSAVIVSGSLQEGDSSTLTATDIALDLKVK
ncbi:MAG: cytochrome c maturation protein CcmE [Coriobacteriales bacterium]|jgi:cytochrome c-type biogenesis protein CcmE|nr:cytochrome c maturation protein CcmE [Coriobacteriales bacterium]